jgi:hypothetical protein
VAQRTAGSSSRSGSSPWQESASLSGGVPADPASGDPDGGGGPLAVDDGERDWWRVEAGSGRLAVMGAGTGVYDLCYDGARGSWSLARVLD